MCLPQRARHSGERAHHSAKRLGLGHIGVQVLAPELNGYFEPWTSCKTSQPLFNHKKGEQHTESLEGFNKGTLCVKSPDSGADTQTSVLLST